MHSRKGLFASIFWITWLIVSGHAAAEQEDLNRDPTSARLVDRLTDMERKISRLEGTIKNLTVEVAALKVEVDKSSAKGQPGDCGRTISSCEEVRSKESGVYKLRSCLEPAYNVYCNQSFQGGGWLVVYDRNNGNSSVFNHTWDSYSRGFGHPDGEHFIGLQRLHSLTYGSDYEAAFILTKNGEESAVIYGDFEIDNDEKRFEITKIGSPLGRMRLFFSNQSYRFQTHDRNHLHPLARETMQQEACAFWFVDSPHSHDSTEFAQFCHDLQQLKIMIRKRENSSTE